MPSAATGSTAQPLTQVGVPQADQFTRANYGPTIALGTSTHGNTWLENPLNFFTESVTDNADFRILFDPATSNGRLQLAAFLKADTTTAHMDVDLNSTAKYTVRFSLKMENVSSGNAGLFVLPRAHGTDVVGNAGWIFRESSSDSTRFEISPFAYTTLRSGSPPVLPLPTSVALGNLLESDLHYIQISVDQNTATLYVDDVKVGDVTTNTYATGGADRVTLGYSAFTAAPTGLGAYIDDFSVALPITPDPPAVPSRFGVNARAATQPSEWPLMNLANVRYLRAGYFWSRIETVQGVYDFDEQWDVVTNMESSSAPGEPKKKLVGLLAYINNTLYPGAISTPATRAAYVRWAAAMAKEYAGRGVIWEIYNEPNGSKYWPPAGNAQEYMELLNATVPAVKAADPTATVVSGGMNVLSSHDTLTWLDGCVSRQLLPKVDGLGVHLYDYDPSDQDATGGDLPKNPYPERVIGELADVRRRTGQPSLPIYNTEWGAAFDAARGITEIKKAEALVRMNLLTLMEDLKLNIWFNWRAYELGGDPNKNVIDVDASGNVTGLRDAYAAMTTMNLQLKGYTFQKRLDLGAGVNQDVYALLFANGANRKIAIWTPRTTAQAVTIPVSTSRNYDVKAMKGEALPALAAEAGRIYVEATTSPQYIDLGTDNASDNQTFDYRFQLETLKPSGPTNVRAYAIGEPTVSGGGSQRLEGTAPAEWHYTTPPERLVPSASYYVMMRNLKAAPGATYQLKVATYDQGTTDLKDPTSVFGLIQEPAQTGPSRSLGGTAPVAFSFKLTTTGTVASVVWNDYIEFVPTVQTFEAENLAQKSDDVTVTRQQEGTIVRDVFPGTLGKVISYTVPIARTRLPAMTPGGIGEPAQYTVTVGFKRQAAAGSFKLEVPESATVLIGSASQAAGTNNFVTFAQKVQFATAGNKEFKFTVTGANGGSHTLTFDYIRLQ